MISASDADAEATPSRSPRWILRLAIITAGAPSTIGFSLLSPIAAKMAVALYVGASTGLLVRMAMTVIGLAMTIAALLTGFLIDRFGSRLLLLIALPTWIVLGLAMATTPSLEVLIVLRFLQGLAAGAVLTVGLAMLGEIENESERGSIAGLHILGSTITALITLPLVGLIGDISWRMAFLLHLLGLPLIGIALVLRMPQRHPREATAGPAAQTDWRSFPFGYAALAFAMGTVALAISTYMPFRFHDLGIQSATKIGIALMAEGLAVGITAAMFGIATRYIRPGHALVFSFGTAAIGAAGTALASTVPLAVAALLVYGIGIGWMVPNLMSLTVSAAPAEQRGRVVGFVKAFHLSAGILSAITLEPIVRNYGVSGALCTVAAASAVVAILLAVRPIDRRAGA